MWTAGSAKSTSAETISSCSEPVSLAELLQAVPDFIGDTGERVLIQHSRNPLGVSQTEQQSRPRQIGIASGAVKDLEQQRHFPGWYPPRQLSDLKAYQRVAEANGIACYFHFHIHEPLYRALGYCAPRQVFGEPLWVASSGAREKPLVPIMS
jgi:hypothetical protein